MDRLILGVDSGNHKAKVVGPYGVDSYKTNICDWFERDVEETFGSDDMEFEINGRKGFAGSIAQYEDDFGGGSMFGDSKNHEDNKIRVLLAVHRYMQKYSPNSSTVRIVTGQPIKRHKESEKLGIIKMLKGEHLIKVNGAKQTINIEDVKVSPEGSGAFWSCPVNGTVRILDIGSGTVNAATIIDKKHINAGSDTFNFGMETIKNKNDLNAMARGIIRNSTMLKWQKNDVVWVCGGIAELILPFIQQHYPNAILLIPQLNGVMRLSPLFGNGAGFYDIAKRVFR